MTTIAIIANPTKLDDVDAERQTIEKVCARHGIERPLWIETTEDDPGGGQTREALERHADVVCAFGGDGTVRAVAEALAGGDVPLGLLPAGTGNLLARALGVPIDDTAEAMEAVLSGHERRIDVGVLRADGGPERLFVVMAGMGLDAEMMDRTDERLKAKVGWPAYLVGGARALAQGGFRAWVQLAGESVVRQRAQAVVIGNSGELSGGLVLMPDAEVDDGLLDVAVVAPRGVVGWTRSLVTLATKGRGHAGLARRQATAVRVRAGRETGTQLDGDPIGSHREIEVRIRPGALPVRLPS
jgi:YegS/Rv2252/BmrU family lipid kinase